MKLSFIVDFLSSFEWYIDGNEYVFLYLEKNGYLTLFLCQIYEFILKSDLIQFFRDYFRNFFLPYLRNKCFLMDNSAFIR